MDPEITTNKIKKSKKGKILTAVLIILIILSLIALAGFLTVNHYLNKINRIDPGNESVIPPEKEHIIDSEEESEDVGTLETWNGVDPWDDTTPADTADPDETSGADDTKKPDETTKDSKSLGDEDLLNIMLIGLDGSGTRLEKRTRTDTMILLSVNTKTGQMSMISFQRDTYVSIPGGYSSNRLNVPYRLGGFPLLYETYYETFGLNIDYGVAVNFDGVTKIVDIVGGVDIKLTAKEAAALKVTLEEDKNHLDGKTALMYARERHIDNDFKRAERQRKVILAVYEKIKGSSLSTINELLNEVLPYLYTDMSNTEIVSTVMELFNFLGNDINSYFCPAYGTFKNVAVNGKAVLRVDFKENKRLLKEEYLPFER